MKHENFGFIKRVDNGRITIVKDLECSRFQRYSFVRANDEGLALERSAFQIFHGDNSTFINSFDKTKFQCLTLNLKLNTYISQIFSNVSLFIVMLRVIITLHRSSLEILPLLYQRQRTAG